MKHTLACLTLGICAFLGLETVNGQMLKSDSKVKMTVKASPIAGGKQVLDIRLKIDDGWYIYANPVECEILDSSQTTVRIGGVDAKQVKVEYPAGVEKNLDDKIKYRAYVGEVSIKATVERGADTSPLKVRVDVNSCSTKEMKCLAPGTLEAKVE